MMNLNNLQRFLGSPDVVLMTDSEPFAELARAVGFRTQGVTDLHVMPSHGICMVFTPAGNEAVMARVQEGKKHRTLFAQTHVFDASMQAAIYTLELICASDISLALQKQREVLLLLDEHDALCLTGEGTDARVDIRPGISPYAMIEEDVEEHFFHPLAELFEVHFAHMKSDQPCPFTASGTFQVAGLLAARRRAAGDAPRELEERLTTLRQRVAMCGASAHVVENRLESFFCEGIDYASLLVESTGKRGSGLTEFAVGVNGCIASKIDYRINSQLNEGIEGIHVAIGDGASGYHIDLLCPAVSVSPLT